MRSEWEIGGVSEYCAQLISLGLPNFRKQIGTAEESIKIVIKIVKDYSRGKFSPATRSCRSRTKLRDNRSSQDTRSPASPNTASSSDKDDNTWNNVRVQSIGYLYGRNIGHVEYPPRVRSRKGLFDCECHWTLLADQELITERTLAILPISSTIS